MKYAGAANKDRLLSLLLPERRAAEQRPWLKTIVADGEFFHPLRRTPTEAFQLLSNMPLLEASGVVLRVPGFWKAGRPPRPKVSATVGGKTPPALGKDALLDFQMEVTLDGEKLTEDEISKLLDGTDGLALVRGRWVEVDRDKLGRMLDQLHRVQKAAAQGGLSFAAAMRMLAGADISEEEALEIDSLVELLQGRVSKSVMERVCQPGTGLFPVAQGDHLHPHLPGLGIDVQACRRGAVQHRRATRRETRIEIADATEPPVEKAARKTRRKLPTAPARKKTSAMRKSATTPTGKKGAKVRSTGGAFNRRSRAKPSHKR